MMEANHHPLDPAVANHRERSPAAVSQVNSGPLHLLTQVAEYQRRVKPGTEKETPQEQTRS